MLRSTPLARSGGLRRKVPLRAYNARRQAKRDARAHDYLTSAVWSALRQARLTIANGRCECGCGRPFTSDKAGRPDVHHKTYRRAYGNEHIDDLRAIRRDCHARIHAQQAWYKRKMRRIFA